MCTDLSSQDIPSEAGSNVSGAIASPSHNLEGRPLDMSQGLYDASTLATTPSISTLPSISTAERTAALFLITFQERYGLSQAAINFAVGSINGILDGVSESIHETAQGLMEAGSCSLDAAFKEREDPFASLQTEYKQLKFYREVFGLVVSEK